MADILIRGMEIPSCCLMCPMYTIPGCRVSKRIFPDWMNVAAVPKDCPLVPLPEGHGGLCDRDALIKELQNLFDKREKDAAFSGNRGPSVTWNDAICSIFAAPVIVPAEGGEADGN